MRESPVQEERMLSEMRLAYHSGRLAEKGLRENEKELLEQEFFQVSEQLRNGRT